MVVGAGRTESELGADEKVEGLEVGKVGEGGL